VAVAAVRIAGTEEEGIVAEVGAAEEEGAEGGVEARADRNGLARKRK
jgi:hypothetical protein